MFSSGNTALCISHNPSIKCISIGEATKLFDIPDLQGALADYLGCEGAYVQNFHSFGQQQCSLPDAHLPFNDLQIWYKVHLQQKSYHDSNSLKLVFMINAWPPIIHGNMATMMQQFCRWICTTSGLTVVPH
ncbi:hypothetical protein PISMIDRAFT_649327 [Pisolithus microcarpus 441]|uniref:Unplaced genomic scaffold scaffold_43, whole genome shotgun sequence n=1 Tax=Pisolithus microcarpus 441 TaxID=765257 RepID=A0A0C9ZUF6_9AGAM|nr:hypothetical protein BKA83DRAFT_649327 [Pisolithus microcarpus]KIK23308.1 hypothetical protein PISMIDRAFT_649327 [Pisolithus microcarpus 441]